MPFANIGPSGLILILIALLLIFGPSKLPAIGKAFGKSLREFKDATRGMVDEASQAAHDAKADTVHQATAAPVEPIDISKDAVQPEQPSINK